MRPKNVLIFIAILAVGLLIEGLKSIGGLSTQKNQRVASLSMKDFDVRPFRISDEDMRETRSRINAQGGRSKSGFHLSANSKLKEEYDFSEGHKVAQNAADKKADGKTDKKKKKKKKSARGRGKGDKKETMLSDAEKYAESEKNKVNESETSQAGQFIEQLNPNAQKDSTLPVTYEDWAKLILGRPQPENVNKLVEYFKNNMVSGEIFYSILDAMLEEPSEEQHKLAVQAAGEVPNPRSFEFLVGVLKNEAQGSTLALSTTKIINSYLNINKVTSLKAVLSMNIADPVTVQMAVQVLDKSTAFYLESRSPSADTEGETATETEPTPAQQSRTAAIKAFRGFEPILESILETYKGQSSIVDPAQRSLTRIKNLSSVVVADING
jgi:hypothetical protein